MFPSASPEIRILLSWVKAAAVTYEGCRNNNVPKRAAAPKGGRAGDRPTESEHRASDVKTKNPRALATNKHTIRDIGSIKDYVSWGAGPRGSQNLVLAAKARALLDGRTAPTIEDVQSVALPVLRHRIIVNHRAVGDNVKPDDVINQLLKQVAA